MYKQVGNFIYHYTHKGELAFVRQSDSEGGAIAWVKGDHPDYTAETNPLTATFLEGNPDLSDDPEMAEDDLIPKWPVFRAWAGQSSSVSAVLTAAKASLPPQVADSIIPVLYRVGEDSSLWNEIANAWNAAIQYGGFTPSEIESIRADVEGIIQEANLVTQIRVDSGAKLSQP